MGSRVDFRSLIAANKFHPPWLAENRVLRRSKLLNEQLGQARHRQYQYIVLEAQAGQGKTTTAIQFLSHLQLPYLWYQVDKEDRDPFFLLTALLHGAARTVSGFSCPQLAALLNRGELTTADLSGAVNLLLTALAETISNDFALVFDDLHLLADAEQSLSVIDCVLETVPPHFSFILLSRKPLPFKSKRLRFSSSTLYLSNEALAFSKQEVNSLLERMFNRPADEQMSSALHAQTGGWVMGLILSAHAGKNGSPPASPFQIEKDDHMLHAYIEEELFKSLDADIQQALVKLSLLDEINAEFGREITGEPDIQKILLRLMEENYFVRSLNDEATEFSIHHLFRSLLRRKAKQLIAPKEYEEILLN